MDDGSIAGGGVACTSVLGVAVESESESDVPVGAVAGKLEHAVTSRAAVKASSGKGISLHPFCSMRHMNEDPMLSFRRMKYEHW